MTSLKKQGYTLRVYVSPENLEDLKRISEVNEVPQSLILERFVAAAIAVATRNEHRLTLPIRFELAHPTYTLKDLANIDPKTKKKL